jgi:SAM-dependent methyltransferase
MLKSIYKYLFSERIRLKIRKSIPVLISPIYTGNKYYCNCCNKSFRKFLPKGNIKRLNAKCPFCSSLERTRVIDLYLDKELNIYNKKNIKILHFAPEDILFKKFIKIRGVEYIDGDINANYARNIIDATNIKYPDNYFDLIICCHVLGHIPDEAKAIKEMYRVLKKDGVALIMTVLSNEEKTFESDSITSDQQRLENYGEVDLCRLHGLDFSHRLAKQGFKTEVNDYRKTLPLGVQNRNRLGDGKREIIYVCRK